MESLSSMSVMVVLKFLRNLLEELGDNNILVTGSLVLVREATIHSLFSHDSLGKTVLLPSSLSPSV